MSSPKNPFTTPQKTKNKNYPFTKKKLDLVPNKPPDIDNPYTRSGFANINKAIKDTNNSSIPNILEGIVLMAPDEPIKYSIKSNNQNKENCSRNYYEGFCIWARTAIHQGILPDPVDILNGIVSNKDKLPTESLRQEEIKYLDAVHAHGMLAPLNEGQKKPIIGEHVKVHYYNSITDSGEIIKGFYEVINNDNAAIELPSTEQQQAIKEIISEKEEQPIIAATDNEVPKPAPIPEEQNNCKNGNNFQVILGEPIPIEIQPLLNMIASREGGYNSMNQGTRNINGVPTIVGSTSNASDFLGKNLTEMTFREILEFQNKPGGSKDKLFAAGKYQLIPVTMRYIVDKMSIPLDSIFSPENQESIGLGLIKFKRPIAWNYLIGKNNNEDAALLALAQEWASLPDPRTGKSFYGGANRAGHTVEKVRQHIKEARAKIIASCA
jgi:hypothetical protein